jgi:hypothetical protein
MSDDTEDVGSVGDNEYLKKIADSYGKNAGSSGGNGGAGALSGALMSTGDPYTMAAGASLAVISSISDKRKKEREAKANAENARRGRLMTAMAGLGSGVGSQGMA